VTPDRLAIAATLAIVVGVAFIWWPLAIVIGGAIMLAAAVLWAWLNVKPQPEDTGGPGE
jgi:ABC-type transport system involved in cytochrome bd biosynthesis fused ATPase/permease subunit